MPEALWGSTPRLSKRLLHFAVLPYCFTGVFLSLPPLPGSGMTVLGCGLVAGILQPTACQCHSLRQLT